MIMIEIFELNTTGSRGTQATPKLDYHFRKQVVDIKKAITYYRNYPVFLNSGNVLTRLLYKLDFDSELPSECFYKAIAINEELSLNLGFASSVHEPVIQSGFNFKDTLIVSTMESRGNLPSTTDWKSLVPLTVMYRPGKQGVYQLPLEGNNSYDGAQVLGIDIPLLAYMFAMFRKERKTLFEDSIVGTSEFIARYVLPNALYSQLDCLMVNHLNGEEELEDGWNDKVPFSAVDHMVDIYQELNVFAASSRNKTVLVEDFLRSLPSTKGTMFNLPFIYKGANTTNTVWFETIANLPLVMGVAKTLDLQDKGSIRNNLLRLDRKINSSRAWNKLPTNELKSHFTLLYNEIFFVV